MQVPGLCDTALNHGAISSLTNERQFDLRMKVKHRFSFGTGAGWFSFHATHIPHWQRNRCALIRGCWSSRGRLGYSDNSSRWIIAAHKKERRGRPQMARRSAPPQEAWHGRSNSHSEF